MSVIHRVPFAVFSCAVAIGMAAASSAPAVAAPPSAPVQQDSKPQAELEPVSDRALVCMVNDKYFGKPQIPVEVKGKTYYGCCAMCKERLANDAASRSAVDPVSGKTVDKASAVIGRASDDTVVYFGSSDNLRKYNERR
jgi:YHS domain-containing protein